jgi:hypothetical protein
MTHLTPIAQITDPQLTALFGEIAFVCRIELEPFAKSTVFDFFEACFTRHRLKQAAKHLPIDGILNTKLSALLGADLERVFRSYCQLRHLTFEAYEGRKLHYLIAALPPRRPSVARIPPPPRDKPSTALIKLRRRNGDL